MPADLQSYLTQIRQRRAAQLQQILAQARAQGLAQTQGAQAAGGGGVGGPKGSLGGVQGLASGIGAAGQAAGGTSSIWTILSALSTRRVKRDIHHAVWRDDLEWVHFRYVPSVDPTQKWQVGLIAEDVERRHPEWVFVDANGDPLGVHYDRIPKRLWP